jgi:excisionase family DNA binding protein
MTASTHQEQQVEKEESSMQKNVAKEWISLKEMQELLNIGSTKAYELVASGSIPGVIKIGRVIRINRRELDDWLQQQSISACDR